MKKPARKLVIRKETIFALSDAGLVHVVGGAISRDVQIISGEKQCAVRDVPTTTSDVA